MVGCLIFEHFARNLLNITDMRIRGIQGNNKDFDIIFWLQFSKVRYIAANCAKFPFQQNYLKNRKDTNFTETPVKFRATLCNNTFTQS